MIDLSVFKAYDVRGTYPDQIDAAVARLIGRAYADHLEPASLIVGRDMRTMAPEIAQAFIEGVTSAGIPVVDIGMVGTEMLYFAVATMGADAGVQITASHIPKNYIGMKLVRRGALPVGIESGLDKVRDLARDYAITPPETSSVVGTVTQVDIWSEWSQHVLNIVDTSAIRNVNVVLDAGNGMGGTMMRPPLERLAISPTCCHFEPDGNFPFHEPNPLLEENRQFIIDEVTSKGADLGIAWDGDADRCFFIDDTGEFVPGDFITALLAKRALRDNPNATVLYDVRASRAVADTVRELGGIPVPSRVGHAFIKHKMRRENAVFAGEISGHYYFQDYFSVDTGIVPALLILEMLGETGQKLSELVAPLRKKYFVSGEINSIVDDVPVKIQQLKERYSDDRLSYTDGIPVDYDDWHFNVRPSNTEPLLRLNLEAYDQDTMEERRDEVLSLLRSESTARL